MHWLVDYAGHVNHSIFWTNLTPPKVRTHRHALARQHADCLQRLADASILRFLCALQDYEPPSGELLKLIEARYKSLDNFQAAFNAAAAGVQVRAVTGSTPEIRWAPVVRLRPTSRLGFRVYVRVV